jgi:glycine/D-amino acid oxidase-like deaminating enzyme
MTAESVGWDRSPVVAGWPGLEPLAGPTTADLCVVGLGASGLAAVRWAVERGLDVVGIDAGRVAAGAAGRNGGFLLGGLARFHHEVVAAVGETRATAWYRATLAELDALAARHGAGVIRRTGSLRLAADDAEWADCEVHAAALATGGIRVERRETPLGRGLLLPDDAVGNPAERCLREARALAGQARLHEATPALAVRPGAVETPAGTISSPAVAVCVDGRLDAVVPALAGRVRTARLQMLATEPVPPVPWLDRPVYGRWGYDWAVQLPDGRVFAGGGRDRQGDDEWTHDDAPTTPVQGHIEAWAARLAGRPVAVADRWAASVGYTGDGLPVCELVDDGVAAAGAYCGTGNLVGPICARRAAALALGEPDPSPELA